MGAIGYAWAWSFCHFMLSTPKYEKNFKKFYVALGKAKGITRIARGMGSTTVAPDELVRVFKKYLRVKDIEELEREWYEYIDKVLTLERGQKLDWGQAGYIMSLYGERAKARKFFKRAIDGGSKDAFVLYGYAELKLIQNMPGIALKYADPRDRVRPAPRARLVPPRTGARRPGQPGGGHQSSSASPARWTRRARRSGSRWSRWSRPPKKRKRRSRAARRRFVRASDSRMSRRACCDTVAGMGRRLWSGQVLLLLAVCSVLASAQDTEIESSTDDPDPLAGRLTVTLEGGRLSLDASALAALDKQADTDDQLREWWVGTLGSAEVLVEIRIYANAKYQMTEPEEVSRFVEACFADPERGGVTGFRFGEVAIVRGEFGWAPFACFASGKRGDGEVLSLCGIYPTLSYSVTVEAKSTLDKGDRDALVALLRGMKSECKPRDPAWSDTEVATRFGISRPKIIRTKHYVVVTNASAGKLFAKKMEECYKKITKAFPIHEVEGRRLLPVYLFRRPKEYYDFCLRESNMRPFEARATKGHAYRDFYATYYDSPNDAVHMHEATHQVFSSRLFLPGGGSWFQEGLAEYMCTKRNERKAAARPWVKKGRLPLAEMIRQEALQEPFYPVAASFIEFLRESKQHRDKFPNLIQTFGRMEQPDFKQVDAALRSIYGAGMSEIGPAWVKYWRR